MKTNRSFCFTFLLLLSCAVLRAQAPSWGWAKNAGGSSYDQTASSTAHASNAIYVVGTFQSASITFGAYTLTNAGSSTTDMYVVCYDTSGTVTWAARAGTSYNEAANAVATDDSGNVYVTGRFSGPSITFGSTTLNNTVTNRDDIFVVKYNAAGTVMWAKQFGGSDNDQPNAIAVDHSSNIYIAGRYYGPSLIFGTDTLLCNGFYDIFLTRLNSNRNAVWARTAGGPYIDQAYALSLDVNGNIYMAGSYQNSSVTFGSNTVTNSGAYDIFLARYSPAGNNVWVKSAGGSNTEEPFAVTADNYGYVYIAGGFRSASLTFGTNTIANFTSGNDDIFVAQFDTAGGVGWLRGAGGFYVDDAYGLCTDVLGNVYVTGMFASDSLVFDTTTIYNGGSATFDLFVAKYTASGNAEWAYRAGSNTTDVGTSITIDSWGSLYVSGHFLDTTITFGSTTLNNNGPGYYDMFLAKLGAPLMTAVAPSASSETISLFPVPCSDLLNIQLKEHTGPSTITICNAMGEIIFTTTSASARQEITMACYAPGIYFCTVVTGETSVTKKFIRVE